MELTEKTIKRTVVYDGRVLTLYVDDVQLPDGTQTIREVLGNRKAACILALDEDGNVLLVRQYRYAYGKTLLELPAGKMDPGEKDPEACIRRELSEETGYTADRVIPLGVMYPSPGYSGEGIYLFLAAGTKKGIQHLDQGEFLQIETMPYKELLRACEDGTISDAKTVITVFRSRRYIREEDGKTVIKGE